MANVNDSLAIHVLMRASKRTGKIDTTMVGMGTALMRIWALSNTTKSKQCFIFNRETGQCVFATSGTDSFPKVKDIKSDEMPMCYDLGIELSDLQDIKDDRFDN